MRATTVRAALSAAADDNLLQQTLVRVYERSGVYEVSGFIMALVKHGQTAVVVNFFKNNIDKVICLHLVIEDGILNMPLLGFSLYTTHQSSSPVPFRYAYSKPTPSLFPVRPSLIRSSLSSALSTQNKTMTRPLRSLSSGTQVNMTSASHRHWSKLKQTSSG
jgi:hypothetical protein